TLTLFYHSTTSFSLYTCSTLPISYFFFFNDTAPTELYTLSLHDALPIFPFPEAAAAALPEGASLPGDHGHRSAADHVRAGDHHRSEEHTSELQSRGHLVCRLLLEKKKKKEKTLKISV